MLIFLLLLGLARGQRDVTITGTRAPPDTTGRDCKSPDMILKCGLYGKTPQLCTADNKPQCTEHTVTIPGRGFGSDKYSLSCPSCILADYVGHLCKERPSLECKEHDPVLEFSTLKNSLCPNCFKI